MSAIEKFKQLKEYLDSQILGQHELTQSMLISLLADGHILVEGPPGLAKTRAIKALCDGIAGDFHRVQFTPDLLPADLTGTDIYRPETHEFEFQKGPLFHNLILADEINRSPAKVQSALLEAMAERQITVGSTTYQLPELFLVMATQNPIEQEGTYPLPEAQLDRFLMHVSIDYPNAVIEREILALNRNEAKAQDLISAPSLAQGEITQARGQCLDLYLAPQLEEYIVQLIIATRTPAQYDGALASWLTYGASPRATIALERCARARAWLNERDFVSPEDIIAVAPNVLRHRLLLSYEAESEGVTPDKVIEKILAVVPVP